MRDAATVEIPSADVVSALACLGDEARTTGEGEMLAQGWRASGASQHVLHLGSHGAGGSQRPLNGVGPVGLAYPHEDGCRPPKCRSPNNPPTLWITPESVGKALREDYDLTSSGEG